jgi:aspartyl-tRNA(Asn)/glutamyl-tRNA(Gln) amidotransferase subunit B
VTVDAAAIAKARAETGELPAAQRARLKTQYGLSPYDAGVLTSHGRAVVAYFEEVAKTCGDAKAACNWISNKLLASAKTEQAPSARTGQESPFALPAADLAGLIAVQQSMGLTKAVAEEVFDLMLSEGIGPKQAIDRKGIKAVESDALVEIVRKAIAANPKAVADFKKGKAAAANSIKGAVMKETKGAAKPDVVQQILMEELAKVS